MYVNTFLFIHSKLNLLENLSQERPPINNNHNIYENSLSQKIFIGFPIHLHEYNSLLIGKHRYSYHKQKEHIHGIQNKIQTSIIMQIWACTWCSTSASTCAVLYIYIY